WCPRACGAPPGSGGTGGCGDRPRCRGRRGPWWWWRSCQGSFALGVRGELEEEVLEARAVCGSKLDQRQATGGRDLTDPQGLRVGPQPLPGRRRGDPLPVQGVEQGLVLDRADVGALGLQELVLGALG